MLRRLVTALGSARDQGHVCIDVTRWIDEQVDVDEAPRPDLATLREQLLATGVVGATTEDGDNNESDRSPLPLVLDAQHRLYTLRHYRAEQRIACQHALPLGRNSCAQAGRQKAYYQVHCPTTPNSTTFSSLCSHSTGCSGKTGSAVAQGLSHRKRACIGKPLRPVGRPPHMSWHLRQGPSREQGQAERK